jgi:pimeloyl-ACP methyl ester carboxylesterase
LGEIEMTKIQANDIEIEYEKFGDKANPTLLLVMGLGVQLVGWAEPFCQMIVDKGFHVIRFDNRDVGLSTHFDAAGMPDLEAIGLARREGVQMSGAPYYLVDMGDDAAGLLDALGIDKAHVVGASLGGYIVQEMAIKHREKLLSMTSIMSTTGRRSLPTATPEATTAVMSRPLGTDHNAILADALKTQKAISGPKYPPIESEVYAHTKLSMARNIDPIGIARQMAAIASSPDRVQGLATVTTPTLVIHGTDDPLVPVTGGKDTASCIPNARLELIDGMGHFIPSTLWQPIADLICEHALSNQ